MKRMSAAATLIVVSILKGQEFEVASVKPADKQTQEPSFPGPLAEMMGFDSGPGRINYHGVTLKMLLAKAYNIRPGQISGPGWLGSERYTIEAKFPVATDAAQMRLMLQRLLTERFQITLHRESKDTPVYRLKVAKNGPKLIPAKELPHYENDEEMREALKKDALESLERIRATREANARNGISSPNRSFSLGRATTERFAEVLSGHLDRPVKDMTQLEGEYSFKLAWIADRGLHDEPSELSIFVAIQEQLGLKLESGNEPIELLVIDKAEKTPIAN